MVSVWGWELMMLADVREGPAETANGFIGIVWYRLVYTVEPELGCFSRNCTADRSDHQVDGAICSLHYP